MSTALQFKKTFEIDRQVEFTSKLTAAHARIEKTFLEGGAVLVSVMDILGSLTGILDGMTGTLDGKTAQSTLDGLSKTIDELAQLPKTEETRQAAFNSLAHMCSSTGGHIEDIHETIRYLKTFVITVKITGAGLAEFAGFADEIRERIQSGADEVSRFAKNLEAMRSQLIKARSFSSGTLEDFEKTIPQIITGLNENSARISKQHQEMADIAAQVKKIANTIQGKIGSVLSSLQIGDITRQRIEHIQSMLEMLDTFSSSDEGKQLDSDEYAVLKEAVLQMAGAQMDETAADFHRDCTKIFASISSFADDAARILSLRDELVDKTRNGDKGTLELMEQGIVEACNLVARVQESSTGADGVVLSVTNSAQELSRGIEILRSIKIDIHYMALNSNLRCSKLGDAGRSVNVVSGEMRVFAGKLETPADAIVEELQRVESATNQLAQQGHGLSADLAVPLNETLQAIRHAKTQMDAGMQALAEEGQAVFSRISSAVVTLDFESELGDTFNECCQIAAQLSQGFEANVSGFSHKIETFSARVYKLYTMSQERDIHVRFLPANVSSASAATASSGSQSAAADDDDLFADALF
ncbi:chemotaxis protein [Agrobacterium rubi]|uniref:Chemotaxis protein n=2 Tax=Agrobacterium rubi TaxID=28099 RepID=A0AAE7R665_9HYPH|nr:chemotaxis protein [Agrobacterium rubi]MBP1878685.1 methyl-accepting chemotaxis protein [Agrobacterium rubi]MCL6652954.1 chemotaxis protein [Agrobacterium rubi]NTE88692.1 chemotaxis protein [Agrobacterium rubi]NTF04520.1 chemotaxis protein [Agrobacterium rubi]NTF10052.1 chemotaxis protein [Agrobacterium rubi]